MTFQWLQMIAHDFSAIDLSIWQPSYFFISCIAKHSVEQAGSTSYMYTISTSFWKQSAMEVMPVQSLGSSWLHLLASSQNSTFGSHCKASGSHWGLFELFVLLSNYPTACRNHFFPTENHSLAVILTQIGWPHLVTTSHLHYTNTQVHERALSPCSVFQIRES